MLIRFLTGKSGSTATEYAILGGMMALAIIGSISALGSGTGSMFDNTTDKITTATKNAGK